MCSEAESLQSNNTISSRNEEISNDMKAQLLERNKFILQSNWMKVRALPAQPSTTVDLCAILSGWRNDRRFHVLSSNAMQNNQSIQTFSTNFVVFFTNKNCRGSVAWYMHRQCSFNDSQALRTVAHKPQIREKIPNMHCVVHCEVLVAKYSGKSVLVCQNCELYQSSPTRVSNAFESLRWTRFGAFKPFAPFDGCGEEKL